MPQKNVKVLVTGAAGQIGYALIFRLASGQAFGADTTVELHLLELEAALPSLHGVAMELDDCAFPLLKNVVCTSDLKQATRDVNYVLSVGAIPRKAGMERSDLLKVNGGIFAPQGRALNENAATNVRVLIVGNPCNTNCLIAMNNAPNIPRDQFFAMTMLDENRARMQLAKKAGVPVTAVTQLAIWGNHSATQYPDFNHAKINGKPVTDVIKDEQWLKTDFLTIVQQRGAEVIKARGASSAASAANAVIDTVKYVHGTEQPINQLFSVASCSNGEYDIDEGLIFSFPSQNRAGKISVVQGLTNNAFNQEKIQATLQELRQERDAVKALGLI